MPASNEPLLPCPPRSARVAPCGPLWVPPLVASLWFGAVATPFHAQAQALAAKGDASPGSAQTLPTMTLTVESIARLSTTSGTSALADRADATTWPGAARFDSSRLQLRTWWGGGNASLGLGANVDASSVQRPAGPSASTSPLSEVSAPVWAVGLRYRFSTQATAYADALRPSGSADGEPLQTRLVMEWKSASDNRLGAFRQGAFSMQLDSGYKLSLRPRGRGLALQLRGQF